VLEEVEGREPGSEDWRAGDWGIVRNCDPTRTTSKHHEGRAWDWHPKSEQTADALLAALLATDAEGHPHAAARRAGLRTIIFKSRIWHSGRRRWTPYKGANPHDDHVHFGFSRDGGAGLTSFYADAAPGTTATSGGGDLIAVPLFVAAAILAMAAASMKGKK
jgi:hypothetical protein